MIITEEVRLGRAVARKLAAEAIALGVTLQWLLQQKLSVAGPAAFNSEQADRLIENGDWAVEVETEAPADLSPTKIDDWVQGLAGRLVTVITRRGWAWKVRLDEIISSSCDGNVITAVFTGYVAGPDAAGRTDWPLRVRHVHLRSRTQVRLTRQLRKERVAEGRCADCGGAVEKEPPSPGKPGRAPTGYRCAACRAAAAVAARRRRHRAAEAA